MGREVRMVPAGWEHPRDARGDYRPLTMGAMRRLIPKRQRTNFQMYETTTYGTPISPEFASPEELACWLADNKASWCGRATARIVPPGVV